MSDRSRSFLDTNGELFAAAAEREKNLKRLLKRGEEPKEAAKKSVVVAAAAGAVKRKSKRLLPRGEKPIAAAKKLDQARLVHIPLFDTPVCLPEKSLSPQAGNRDAAYFFSQYFKEVLRYGYRWQHFSRSAARKANTDTTVRGWHGSVMSAVIMADYSLANENLVEAKTWVLKAHELCQLYFEAAKVTREELRKNNERERAKKRQKVAPVAASAAAAVSVPNLEAIELGCFMTREEWLYAEAYYAWLVEGDNDLAIEYFEDITSQVPRDMFAAKRAQLVAFCMGDAPRMLDLATTISTEVEAHAFDRPPPPYFFGMLAFAYEQNGLILKAKNAGRRGLALNLDDVWSEHAINHADLAYVAERPGFNCVEVGRFADRMSFMYVHLQFHDILFRLQRNEFAEAMNVFKSSVWPSPKVISEAQVEGAWSEDSLIRQRHCLQNTQDQLGALQSLWFMQVRFRALSCKMQQCLPDAAKEFDPQVQRVLTAVQIPTNHGDPLFDLCVVHALSERCYAELSKAKETCLARLCVQVEDMIRVLPNFMQGHPEGDVARNAYKSLVLALIMQASCQVSESGKVEHHPCIKWFEKGTRQAALYLVRPIFSHSGDTSRIKFVGGSLEQRSILSEWYLELLVSCGELEEASRIVYGQALSLLALYDAPLPLSFELLQGVYSRYLPKYFISLIDCVRRTNVAEGMRASLLVPDLVLRMRPDAENIVVY